jgi:hypothetical protein
MYALRSSAFCSLVLRHSRVVGFCVYRVRTQIYTERVTLYFCFEAYTVHITYYVSRHRTAIEETVVS